MLRPVKLNTPRDPWTGQSHECRLNHMIIVYKIIIICLIISPLNPAPQFRQKHNLQILILQIYSSVLLILLHITDRINRRIRIHLATTSLIHPLLQKNRILLCLPNLIRWNLNRFFPYLYFIHNNLHFCALPH